MRLALLLLLVSASTMTAQKSLPDAPKPAFRPFAVNVAVNQKYSFTRSTNTTTVQTTFDYRFLHNRLRAGLTAGYGIQTNEKSISVSLNTKLFEWGRAR